ncbi:hypothetical protein ACIP8U_21220 [Streptomyces pseudovenezuelae]|uniref:hypothetical protein n=1 Tax=Streptomyces pseudovenezuelae TaxID=67350 RepID=UPI0036F1082C
MTAADWIKFTPGWLAFVISVGTLVHKWWRGRHVRALGPDSDALRTLLADFRTWFAMTLDEPVTQTQLQNTDGTTSAHQRLNDLIGRRSDEELIKHLERVGEHWAQFSAYLMPGSPYMQPGTSQRAEWEAERERLWDEQRRISEEGRNEVEAALGRLNKLERKNLKVS